MQIHRTSVGLVVAALGLWLFLGLGVVPNLIESAYRGESFEILNRAVVPYLSIPADFLVAEWMAIVAIGAVAVFVVAAFAYVLGRPDTARSVIGEATPGDVGAMRMLVCAVLLISTLWEDLASTAALPRDQIRPMGILRLLYALPIGFEWFAASPAALETFDWLTSAVLFFGMIGWKTRLMVPIGAVCYLILGGLLRQYAWFYHTGLIGLYLLFVLALLPSHHGWSVDRLVSLWKGEPVPTDLPSRRYGWMRFALWTALAVPYVMAGLSKLRNGGLMWWEASNFKFILYQSALRPMEFDFDLSLLLTSAPEGVFELLALSALFGEILYGFVLFSRRARRIMPTVMLFMHAGILLMQNILFFDLILLQALFFNFRPLRKAAAGVLARRFGLLTLYFDPAEVRHLRLVPVLRAMDLFGRLEMRPTQPGLAGASNDRFARPRTDRLTTGFTGVVDSTVLEGTHLWRRIVRSIPALWWALPLTYAPTLAGWITRKATGITITARSSRWARPMAFDAGGSRLTLAIAVTFTILWVFRVEFYPLTGMQMFSKKRSEPVTYEILLARLRSGDVGRAPVEKSIKAMSDGRYRRVLEQAFDLENEHVAAAFLDSVRGRWNRNVSTPSEEIEGFEIQQWEWHFLSEPAHPPFGRLIRSKTYPALDVDVTTSVSAPDR